MKRLTDFRQSITFMVINGFSLLEVRKLYIDEFIQYYESLIVIMEKKGELAEGTSNRLHIKGGEETINDLKKQLFKIQ